MERRKAESIVSEASTAADGYIEYEPTVAEFIHDWTPTPKGVLHYFHSLFPFVDWIFHYNLQWFIGDLVAGLTVAGVVIPQSMGYAKLALLPIQYGLYSSFMGVVIYWFFATSKDITIGPVAVLSTVVGSVVADVTTTHPQFTAPQVATSLAVISGAFVCAIGLFRLGFIVEFISLASIAAYMTGSAISIAASQVPALMGITGFSNRDATYKVIINTLKGLPRTKLDAALGLTSLALLYIIRFVCNYSGKKFPAKAKLFFFLATLRTVFVLLLYTLISWVHNRHHKTKPSWALIGNVPRGFKAAGVPTVNKTIITAYAKHLPGVVIVMLIEHISISKSFGRVNNYVINPSQELVAIGITNLLGPFVGAYPATGSFSRTAIKSKAGVRTPFAGVITGLIVLIAIYCLQALFFYIPSAALSAVIIHAVGDLITSPKVLYKFWRISPLEVFIYFIGVFVTVFSSIENGIYCTVSISAALLFFRMLKAKGRFLGKVRIHDIVHDGETSQPLLRRNSNDFSPPSGESRYRDAFLPIDHADGTNPAIEPSHPYPGVFIYRFTEGLTFPSAQSYLDCFTHYIFARTRRTNLQAYRRPGDRPWNDPGPFPWAKGVSTEYDESKPVLRAVVLDFASVNNLDITTVQGLIDVRNQLDRYASPNKVEWHFASVNNRWAKRALAVAGFGYLKADDDNSNFKSIFSVADLGGDDSAAKAADVSRNKERESELESGIQKNDIQGSYGSINGFKRIAAVHGINLPLFHVDLTAALEAALHNTRSRDEVAAKIADIERSSTKFDHVI